MSSRNTASAFAGVPPLGARPRRLGRIDLARVFLSRTALESRMVFTLAACLLAVMGVMAIHWPGAHFLFPLDDAYITIHNALSLLAGRDPNYSGVNPLIGATSLVHLALVTVACLFGSPVQASYGVSLFGVVALVAALATMTLQRGGSRVAASVVIVLGLFGGYMPLHLVNGLETGLAVAAVTWAIVLADRPAPTRWLPILCGTLPFIRPELGVLSGLLLLRQMMIHWRGSETRRGALGAMAIDLALAGAAAFPWLAWSFAETGALIPNTAGAKVAFFAEAQLPLGDRALRVATTLALAGLLPTLAALFLTRTDSLTVALRASLIVVIGLFLWRFPGGLAHNDFRYCMIFVPLGLYGLVRMVVTRADLVGRLTLIACLATSVAFTPIVVLDAAALATSGAEMPKIAEWAARNLPAEAIVLVHDAGYLAFATKLHLVDVVGLKTPDAAAIHEAVTWPSGGADRARAIGLIAARHRVTHAVILDDDGYWSRIGVDLRREGWQLTPVWSTGRPNAYVVYALVPPVTPGH